MLTVLATCVLVATVQSVAGQTDVCRLPPVAGTCNNDQELFYYDWDLDLCQTFTYSGCGGNENRFPTQELCRNACKSTSPGISSPRSNGTQTGGPVPTPSNNPYNDPSGNSGRVGQPCPGREMLPWTNLVRQGMGLSPMVSNCTTENGDNFCQLPAVPGSCEAYMPMFFFNATAGTCQQFIYGGCGGNRNRFNSPEECQRTCQFDQSSVGNNGGSFGPQGNDGGRLGPRGTDNGRFNSPGGGRFGNPGGDNSRFEPRGSEGGRSVPPGANRGDNGVPPNGNRNNFDPQDPNNVARPGARGGVPLTPAPTRQSFFPPGGNGNNAGAPIADVFGAPGNNGGSIVSTYPSTRVFGNNGNNRGNPWQPPVNAANEIPVTARDPAFGTPATVEEIATKQPPGICSQPAVTGPCRARFVNFFYNSTTGRCEKFIYGGCQGNENRFESEQACQATCPETSPMREVNASCFLPSETGPCKAYFPKYFYNSASETCEEFIYGGCDGNANQFDTVAECQLECQRSVSYVESADICTLRPETGPCFALFQRFAFNSVSGRCEPFTYGGCGGNDNRFETERDCQTRCGGGSVDLCSLLPETGPCRAAITQFFYNETAGECQQFTYGGCDGNDNRFDTQDECKIVCGNDRGSQWLAGQGNTPDAGSYPATTAKVGSSQPTLAVANQLDGGFTAGVTQTVGGGYTADPRNGNVGGYTPDPINPNEAGYTPDPRGPNRDVYTPGPDEINATTCFQPPQTGPCRASIPKFFFNASSQTCQPFTYGGCGGNENRFDSEYECQTRCQQTATQTPSPDTSDLCNLPAEPGLCLAYFPKFFYNSASGRCESFIYGGCGGNGNRFDTAAECEGRCGNAPQPNNGDFCFLDAETGPCRGYMPMFAYNASTGQCESFIYGGCRGNDNRFETVEECLIVCQDPVPAAANNDINGFWNYPQRNDPSQTNSPSNDPIGNGPPQSEICTQPADSGVCMAYFPMYFYNATSSQCESFIYGGCGGNENRFQTEPECLNKCDFLVPW